VTNENDENSAGARLTRAKAQSLNVDELALPAKPLQSKKTALGTNAQGGVRKRAALGDVSNVTNKLDVPEGKKAGVSKVGLVSKAAAPTGIQKKTNASRTALATKETNKKVEVKRAGSGAGAIGGIQKRKVSVSVASTTKSIAPSEEGEPLRKKVHVTEVEKHVQIESESEETVSNAEPEVQVPLELPAGVKDLDADDVDDPLMVAEYATEIFEYLRDLECKSIPNPQYMAHQDDLEWKTRGILVDWLIEVHTRFHLLPETLFLAINIIDRFLSEKVVQLERLQLVGVTAMFIASKYEEVISPHVGNFRHVTDDGFTEAEILNAERFILQTLNYDLSYPNPMNFLRRISKADNYDIHCRTIGKYLMEIALVDHRLMAYRPSHLAAAAMYLARLILDHGEWDETLSYYAGYTEDEIEPVFQLMIDYLARPIIHEAFFKKYASKKFLKGKKRPDQHPAHGGQAKLTRVTASILTRQWAHANAELYGVRDTELSLDDISS
jgi:G2/mitotic-specific cyclin 2